MTMIHLYRRYKRWNPVHVTAGAFWGFGIGLGCGVGWGPGFGPKVIGYVGAGCGAGISVGSTLIGVGIGLPASSFMCWPCDCVLLAGKSIAHFMAVCAFPGLVKLTSVGLHQASSHAATRGRRKLHNQVPTWRALASPLPPPPPLPPQFQAMLATGPKIWTASRSQREAPINKVELPNEVSPTILVAPEPVGSNSTNTVKTGRGGNKTGNR